ncbi:MAG: HAD family acid phosphatase [Candidatus Velthaea sp.]|jgi:hypothetical protein
MNRPSFLRAAFLGALCIALAPGSTVRAQAVPIPAATPACAVAPSCSAPIASSQLPNLGELKSAIGAYFESGNYLAEVGTIETAAQAYLDARVQAGVSKPALVLDIDDTSLSTYGYEKAHGFGFDEASWDAAAQAGFPAIEPTLALAKHASEEHVAVLFITGRRTPQAGFTRDNLIRDGFPVDGLSLRPVDDHSPSVAPFKAAARAAIEAAGYDIVESIGDQWSDLVGGHAERVFKLPNPMYFLP